MSEKQKQARMQAWARVAATTARKAAEAQTAAQAEQASAPAQGYAVGANGNGNANGNGGTAPPATKPEEKKEDSSTGKTILIGVAIAVLGGVGWEMLRRWMFEEEDAAAELAVAQALPPAYPQNGGPWMQPVPMPYPVPQYPVQAPAAPPPQAVAPAPDTVRIEVPRDQFDDGGFWRRLAGAGDDVTDVEFD